LAEKQNIKLLLFFLFLLKSLNMFRLIFCIYLLTEIFLSGAVNHSYKKVNNRSLGGRPNWKVVLNYKQKLLNSFFDMPETTKVKAFLLQ